MSAPPCIEKRILFVDSNAIFLALASELIADQGYTVIPAATGVQAIATLRLQKVDLLLSELLLVGSVGWPEVISFVRSTPPIAWLPVIVLSTHAQARSRCLALRAGADAFIAKPFEPEELLALLGAQLARVARMRIVGAAEVTPVDVPSTLPELPLTPAEEGVLRLVSRGLPNKAIAKLLGVRQRTVESHICSVLNKTGCANRTQAARWALLSGRA